MSTESTPTPAKKKDKIFGFDTEDVALGLGATALAVALGLGIMKIQEMGILPKPPLPQGNRVTVGPPPDMVSPAPIPVVEPTTGGVVERDPLGPNTNSIAMDDYVDREKLAKSRAVDRINAGY